MKKVLKIIVPLLLILAIIGGSFWYLFVYDRTFTQDLLLQAARYFDDNGSTSTAQWFYNRAYDMGDDTDAVAIELANQYKNDGNYSKAEYTLGNAIKDGGGASLYQALSKVYVEQGKLYDALILVDEAPEDIRQQLAPQIPAAPIADREEGSIDDYGPISISATGKLYVNTKDEVPSVRTDLYKGPITLVAGQNVIRAIVVADNGLVNQATFHYTVHGVIEPVEFADAAVEREIRKLLAAENSIIPDEVSAEAPLFEGTVYTNQLWNIEAFTVPEDAVKYDDLRHLLYLKKLTIQNGQKDQLSFLADKADLTELDLTGTPVSTEEIKAISSLTNLTKLVMSKCGIISIDPLSKLTRLQILDLQGNTIKDISHLENLTSLTELYLNGNAINDISVVEKLRGLTKLNVSNNDLSSIAPAFKLIGLTHLYAASQGQDETGGLTSIDGIQNLTNLTHLSLAANKLTDISQLAACTKLQDLDISSNNLTSVDALKNTNELMFLNFSRNSVEKIPQFSLTDSKLSIIDGSYNQISSVEPMAGHRKINKIYMDHNEKIADVNCLITCHALLLVSVDGTNVKEADDLLYYYPDEESPPLETGIKVIFDPTKEGKN